MTLIRNIVTGVVYPATKLLLRKAGRQGSNLEVVNAATSASAPEPTPVQDEDIEAKDDGKAVLERGAELEQLLEVLQGLDDKDASTKDAIETIAIDSLGYNPDKRRSVDFLRDQAVKKVKAELAAIEQQAG